MGGGFGKFDELRRSEVISEGEVSARTKVAQNFAASLNPA